MNRFLTAVHAAALAAPRPRVRCPCPAPEGNSDAYRVSYGILASQALPPAPDLRGRRDRAAGRGRRGGCRQRGPGQPGQRGWPARGLPGPGPARAGAAGPGIRRQHELAHDSGPPDPGHRPPGHRAAPARQRDGQPGRRRQRAERRGQPRAARRRALGQRDRLLCRRGGHPALGPRGRWRAQSPADSHPGRPVPRRPTGRRRRGIPAQRLSRRMPPAGAGQQPAQPARGWHHRAPAELAVAVEHRRQNGGPAGLGPAGWRGQRAHPVRLPGPADQPLPAAHQSSSHRHGAAGHRDRPGPAHPGRLRFSRPPAARPGPAAAARAPAGRCRSAAPWRRRRAARPATPRPAGHCAGPARRAGWPPGNRWRSRWR